MKSTGEAGKRHTNRLGDHAFAIRDSSRENPVELSFEFSCDNAKRIWAQETLLLAPEILTREKGEPILVKSIKWAKDCCVALGQICEYWENNHPRKSLWNWTEKELSACLQSLMIRREITERFSSPVYSKQRLTDYTVLLNLSHSGHLKGKTHDSLSFPVTKTIKSALMQPLLDDLGLTPEEWARGKSHPPLPLGVASVLLSQAISTLESEESKVAMAFYSAWRLRPTSMKLWFISKNRRFDIIQASYLTHMDPYRLKEQLKIQGVEHTIQLPWKNLQEFRFFRRRLIGACLNIIFIQTGHRSHELLSTVSNDRRRKNGSLLVRQALDKSLDGIKVYRPLPELSSKSAETLWNLSFIDPDKFPIPLQHSLHDSGYARQVMENTFNPSAIAANENLTLNKRLNSFYQSDVLPVIPEAHNIHPRLSTHQFRHTFAEFALRRFDEDIHERLREHFVHSSGYSTLIYERWKLSPAVQTMLEKDYLYELIGKTAAGKLEMRFWGPAYHRIKNMIEKLISHIPVTPKSIIGI
jgi:integrase